MILFSGEKFSALTPQNGVQIHIVQLAPILASGELCLSGFLATDRCRQLKVVIVETSNNKVK